MTKRIRIPFVYLVVVAISMCATFVDAVEFQSIQRLRRQGLYRAAERKCLDLLDAKLSESDRALTLVEYLRTVEAHVSTTDASERERLIATAKQKIDAYVRKHADSPYGFLVSIQFAVTKSANARLARFDAEANFSADGFETAIAAGRSVIRDFEKLQDEISSAMRDASNRRPGRGFSQVQFQRLRNTVEWETARAWVNLAQCFPNSKKDRISVLAKAVDLTEPLTRLAANPVIATKAKLLDAECRRYIGEANRAQQILTTMAADPSLAPCFQLAVATQQIWLQLDAQQLRSAQTTANRANSIRCDERQSRAEFAYVLLKLYVDLAVQNGQTEDVWRLRADQQNKSIAREFPGYWQRRSEIVFAELKGGSAVAAELASLEAQATKAFGNKNLETAVALFEQAAALAEQKKLRDRAFEFRYRAGAILHQQKAYAAASEVLRRAACDDPDMPDADKAHLLAIIDAAQLVQSGGSRAVENYADLLDEHLAKWPNGRTVNQVAWWLGQLRHRQVTYVAAVEAYSRIQTNFAEYRKVIDALRDCHSELVAAVDDPRHIPDAVSDGVQQMKDIATKLKGENEELYRWAVLNSIDLELMHPSKTALAERSLAQVIQAATIADDSLANAKGNALLLVVFVAQGRLESANRILGELDQLKAAEVRALMRRIQGKSTPRIERNLASIQLKLFKRQDDGQVSVDIRELYAQSLIRTGDFDTAVSALRDRLRDQPHSRSLRKELAIALQHANKPKDALSEWRKLAAGTRPASDDWFLAKYGIADNLLATGHAGDAAEVIRVTQALHPSLGGAELKNRFAVLLRRCEQK